MVRLSNQQLTVRINEQGAEMSSVIDNKTGYEFVWQADEDFWARHAPVLFPIVGRLKDDQYTYEGKTYHMSQHGFARDTAFEVENISENKATFSLLANEKTLEKYPFAFKLLIHYTLEENSLKVTYEVQNTSSNDVMYYGIGGHPAFNVSQTKDEEGLEEFDQVSVEFIPAGEYLFIPLADTGLLKLDKKVVEEVSEMHLTHESFRGDAFIYEMNEDTEIILKDEVENVSIQVVSENMKHVGIWSPYPKRAGFVCIEPWAGLADAVDSSGEYSEKFAINKLNPTETAVHGYLITFNKGA